MSVDLTKYEILDTLCLPFAKRDRIEDIDPRIRGKGYFLKKNGEFLRR